jgi:hypothetical protein
MLSIGNRCHEPIRKACATAASRNAQSGSFAGAWTWPDPGQADPAFGALHAEEACRVDIELRCRSDSHPFVGIGGRLASSSTKVVYESEERPLELQQLATHPPRRAFACSRYGSGSTVPSCCAHRHRLSAAGASGSGSSRPSETAGTSCRRHSHALQRWRPQLGQPGWILSFHLLQESPVTSSR